MSSSLALMLWVLSAPLQPQSQDWNHVRKMAETHHEIIMLLIEEKQFPKVLEQCKKLFALQMPPDQEHRLVESAKKISKALFKVTKSDLAQTTLNEALKGVRSDTSKAELCREKAYLYRESGQNGEAMKFFEMSLTFEKSKH